MTLTSHRIIQYIIILLILVLGGGGYWYWKNAEASVIRKAASKSGLVGYWSFDEGSGTGAGDASGNNNTGTLTNGPTWTSGKLGQGVAFDGTDDEITTTTNQGNGSNLKTFTLSAWFKTSSASGHTIIGLEDAQTGAGATDHDRTLYVGTDGKVRFYVYDAGAVSTKYAVSSASTYNDNNWHHAVGVASGDGANMMLYVDGVLQQSTAITSYYVAYANSWWRIGGYKGSGTASPTNGYFTGSIDEVRTYNRALGATEITDLYVLGAAQVNTSQNSQLTNGLVANWPFNGPDISGTTAYDRSTSGINGTLTNGPVATSGRVGQGMSFDGVDDYMETSSAVISDSASATFSAWVKLSASGATQIMRRGQDGFGAGWSVSLTASSSGGASLSVVTTSGGAAAYSVSGTTAFTQGVWYHVTGVWAAGGSVKIYVNGILEGTTATTTTTLRSSTVGVRLARAENIYYNTTLDEARIYNRVLTATEITDLYALGEADKINSSVSQPQGTGRSDAGLSSYWKLDENTGTSASDATLSANTGTLTNGPTWTTGKIGSAVNFDGVDDFVTLGATSSAFNFSGGLSASAWIKTATDGKIIVSYQNNNPLFYMQVGATTAGGTANKFVVYLRTNGGSVAVFNGSKTITDNLWHHVAFTRDTAAQLVTLYVDGAIDTSAAYTDTGAIDTSGSGHSISTTSPYTFNGPIDEVRVYHRVLTAKEMLDLALVTAPTGVDTSLVGYWSFNGPDISGTTARDNSTAFNNGTLTNGPAAAIGKLGQGLSFDGTNDYVAGSGVPYPSFADNLPITVSSWVKTSYSAGAEVIAGTWNYQNTSGWRFAINSDAVGKIDFILVDSTGVNVRNARGSITVTDGNWHHVLVTYDGSQSTAGMKFYVDSVLDTTVSVTNTSPGTLQNSVFNLGKISGSVPQYFNGTLDEVRIYNRALSAAEILALYNLTK